MMQVLSILLPLLVAAAWLFLILRPRSAMVLGQKVVSPLADAFWVSAPVREFASLPSQPANSGISLSKCGPGISLHVTSAVVRVKRDGISDRVVIKANFPSDWSVDNGAITQVNTPGGHVLTHGDNALVIHGMSGFKRAQIEAHRVQLQNGTVLVDGKTVKPLFDGDEIEVTVPVSFTGNLSIVNEGSDDVEVESWHGGRLSLEGRGNGDFSGGDLTGLESLKITVNGNSAVTFGKIEGRDFDATFDGGNFEAGSIEADRVSLTVVGTGDVAVDSITALTGEIKLPADSNSNVAVDKIKATGKFLLESLGVGDVEITTINGGEWTARFGSSSNLTVTSIEVDEWDFSAEGTGDFSSDVLRAPIKLALKLDADSNCNLTFGTLDSQAARLESLGVGDLNVDTIRGGSFTARFESSSNCNVEETIDLSGKFTLEMLGTGDASLPSVNANEVEARSTENANISFSWLKAASAHLKNEGSGDIGLEDGDVDRLELTASDSGDISVDGSYGSLHTNKSGSGTISIS